MINTLNMFHKYVYMIAYKNLAYERAFIISFICSFFINVIYI